MRPNKQSIMSAVTNLHGALESLSQAFRYKERIISHAGRDIQDFLTEDPASHYSLVDLCVLVESGPLASAQSVREYLREQLGYPRRNDPLPPIPQINEAFANLERSLLWLRDALGLPTLFLEEMA
jgi:hypothetical protein